MAALWRNLGIATFVALILTIFVGGCTIPGMAPPGGNQTGETNGTQGGTQQVGFSFSPEVAVRDFGLDIPLTLSPSEGFTLSANLRNIASTSVERGFVRNVEAQFYDFSDYVISCPTPTVTVGVLNPQEEEFISCICQVKSSVPTGTQFSHSPKLRVRYSYDLYAVLDGVSVMSKSEFLKEKPLQQTITSTVSGPLSVTLQASDIPAKVGEQFKVTIILAASDPSLIEGPTETAGYDVGVVRIGVPPEFEIVSEGQFDQVSTEGGYTWLNKYGVSLDATGQASFYAYLTMPYIPGNSPSETYSFRASTSSFNVVKTTSTSILIEG